MSTAQTVATESSVTRTHRDRALAALRYQPYDRLPLVHFGFWADGRSTLMKWVEQGHLSEAEVKGWGDGNAVDHAIAGKLGFDFNWQNMFHPHTWLRPSSNKKC